MPYPDDYPPIAEHGLIGDLQTAALVTTGGTVDWFCCPRFDSPSVFAALLDRRRGGYFRIVSPNSVPEPAGSPVPDADGFYSYAATNHALQFTTIMTVPFSRTVSSTAAAVRSSRAPTRVNSARIGAMKGSG